MKSAAPKPRRVAGPKHVESPPHAAQQPARRAPHDGEAAEHDWLATLDLVRQASRQVRQTDAAAKNLALNAQALIDHANWTFDGTVAGSPVKLPGIAMAGLWGAVLSWLALLWFIFAEEPLFGLIASSPAATRHHLITLTQCALFTSLAVVVVGVLQRGFGALAAFFEAVVKRSAQHSQALPVEPAPAGPVEHTRKQALREGMLGGRPYVLFSDKSVELETVFGMRSFASLAEAQEFIGEP